MQSIPPEGSKVILAFSSLFSKKVFEHVKVLLLGALLTIGKHTVGAAFCFMGLRQESCFHKYHRVLSRVKRLTDHSICWQSRVIAQWYNQKHKKVLVATGTAIWYHSGITPVPIRWVLIKDKEGKGEPVALLSTNTKMSAQQILSFFIRRWSVEVTFKEVRTQ